MIAKPGLLVLCLSVSVGVSTPPAGPVPQPKPSREEPVPSTAPLPAEPRPAPRPRDERDDPPAAAPQITAEDPETYSACLGSLSALGVEFREIARIDDGGGCGIDRPLAVSGLSHGVQLVPEATLRCETALGLARMIEGSVRPFAGIAHPGKGRLVRVRQASAYVCRNRNGAEDGKISEHARGNAIDIAGLDFEKGDVPMQIVVQEDSDLAAAFQRSINAAACLYFTTVLAPGSDEAHKDHMHLDVIARRGGYRYCR